MATKKAPKTQNKYPIITVGSHSTRTEYANGKVEFVSDDEKLRKDIEDAINEYKAKSTKGKKKSK